MGFLRAVLHNSTTLSDFPVISAVVWLRTAKDGQMRKKLLILFQHIRIAHPPNMQPASMCQGQFQRIKIVSSYYMSIVWCSLSLSLSLFLSPFLPPSLPPLIYCAYVVNRLKEIEDTSSRG